MATVIKRILPSGLVTWRASYTDAAGIRRTKQFAKKGAADAWLVETQHDVARGVHTPGSISPTVKDAAALWIKRCNEKGLEPMTVKGYEEHITLHLLPFIGAKKLSDLNVPAIHSYADQLRDAGRSPEMIRRVIRSLGSIYKEARRRGLSSAAPTIGLDLDVPDRDDPRPVIPTKTELQAIIAEAKGRWRPLILTAIFCGLRASELRGLCWNNIDFEAKQINLTQRADASHRIGRLKSKAAYRTIPAPPMVINALREWKLQCPKGELGLVFPNKIGKVESSSNLLERGLHPVLKAANLPAGAYGMHSLRHACASLWIASGHNPKQIQRLMGHSSIKVTFDVYGHLFADADADQRAAASVQARLLGD